MTNKVIIMAFIRILYSPYENASQCKFIQEERHLHRYAFFSEIHIFACPIVCQVK